MSIEFGCPSVAPPRLPRRLIVVLALGLGACASAPERQPVAGIFPAYATPDGQLGLVPLRWTDAALPVSLTERIAVCPADATGPCTVPSPCSRPDRENCAPATTLQPGQNVMTRSIGLIVEPTGVK